MGIKITRLFPALALLCFGLPRPDSEAAVVQRAGDDYVAFEAEAADSFTESPGVRWETRAVDEASGGAALFTVGDSLGLPGGIATYRIRFAHPGKYVLYTRWKADAAIAESSPFSANSFSYPRTFGDSPVWARSRANEQNVPESLVFDWTEENIEYEVTSAEIATGTEFVFRIGTRESGLILDRIVLKQGKAVAETVLNAAATSPSPAEAPQIAGVLAGNDLETVRVVFDRAIGGPNATNFRISNLSVLSASVDLAAPSMVWLGTTAQTPGAEYEVTVNDLAGLTGAPILPNTRASFIAATLLSGWVRARLSGGLGDQIQWLDRFAVTAEPGTEAELRAFFVPPAAGRYAFYVASSAAAEIALGREGEIANPGTALVVEVSLDHSPVFAFTSAILTAGTPYQLIAKVRGSSGPTRLEVAAQLSGSSEPFAPLSEDRVANYLNAAAANLRVVAQTSATTMVAGDSARFEITVSADASPVFIQWQKNGVDIAGATGLVYSTARLTVAESADVFRARVKAGGQSVVSSPWIVTVIPPPLKVNRSGGVTITWDQWAAGAALESSPDLRENGNWRVVPGHEMIDSAGSFAAEGSAKAFFRLRQ